MGTAGTDAVRAAGQGDIWVILPEQPQHFRLDGPTRLKFTQDLTERKTRMDWVRSFMRQLEENAIA